MMKKFVDKYFCYFLSEQEIEQKNYKEMMKNNFIDKHLCYCFIWTGNTK